MKRFFSDRGLLNAAMILLMVVIASVLVLSAALLVFSLLDRAFS